MRVEITAGAIASDKNQLVVDGVDISDNVRTFSFDWGSRNDMPTLTVEYMCFETFTMEGEAVVRHYCPIEGQAETDAA